MGAGLGGGLRSRAWLEWGRWCRGEFKFRGQVQRAECLDHAGLCGGLEEVQLSR